MRTTVAAMACLAFVAAACSGSSGNSSAAGTTGGPQGTTGGPLRLAAGKPCAFNAACASGVCGANGSGNCCAAACATSDPTCAATDCDNTGACSYPPALIDCPSTCTGSTLSQNSCNGAGACVAADAGPCPGHFACTSDGICNPGCTSSMQCASGFYCNQDTCQPALKTGACSEDDDCTSGQCGTIGIGHCCTAACANASAPCGAPDCGADSGACLYPTTATPCGSVLQSCTGNTQINATHCDGAGTCLTPANTDCTPYVCGSNACLTSCDANSQCVSGGEFCDVGQRMCCGSLASGGSIAVDSVNGNDLVACCGFGGREACQTISHAMALIDAAQTANVTINATVKGAGGDWAPTGEVFPILLGWGAELNAPGIYFSDPGTSGQVFNIGRTSKTDDAGYASIVGAAGKPITIGIDLEGDLSKDTTLIQVEATTTLYLSNANLNSSEQYRSTAINVAAGGGLILGGDYPGNVTGTVTIGNTSTDYYMVGYKGIVCGTAKNLGCTIKDVALKGASSVVIEGQVIQDIDAEDYAVIALSSAPTIGLAPSAAGFLTCPYPEEKTDAQAVLLNGKASVEIDNGIVQCISGNAFTLQSTANGSPTLTLNGTTIQNSQIGVYASAGTADIASSTIRYNITGVEQTSLGVIDLSGGGDGGTNTVACSSDAENVNNFGGSIGVSVWNTSSSVLNASNVSWDTSGPDVFKCNANLGNCACEISLCTDSPGADGMDAVYESTGTITTTGNQLSSLDCTPPPLCGSGCSGGAPCCGNRCLPAGGICD